MRTAPKDKAEHHILPDRRARGLLDQAIPLIEWAKHTYAKWRIGILGTGPTMPRRDSETAADALFIDAPTELAAPRYAHSIVGSLDELRQKSLNLAGDNSV